MFTRNPRLLDLVALVRNTVTTLQPEDGEMVVRTPDELAVQGDGHRLRHVLENLLTNAM